MDSKCRAKIEINNLFRMSSLLHRVIDSHFKHEKFDRITIRQVRIIEEVFYSRDAGIRLKDLANRLCISSSAASQAVDSLVRINMLERVQSSSDRREIFIKVSDLIRKSYEDEKQYLEKLLCELLSDINPGDISIFSEIAEKIVTRLGAELNFN
jgi:DNA-binding MarR family transcriptional regulator